MRIEVYDNGKIISTANVECSCGVEVFIVVESKLNNMKISNGEMQDFERLIQSMKVLRGEVID